MPADQTTSPAPWAWREGVDSEDVLWVCEACGTALNADCSGDVCPACDKSAVDPVWQVIETAPRDGSIVRARRVLEDGRVFWEGDACWRAVTFPEMPPHPLGGDIYAGAYTETDWMYPQAIADKFVPGPTHWKAQP